MCGKHHTSLSVGFSCIIDCALDKNRVHQKGKNNWLSVFCENCFKAIDKNYENIEGFNDDEIALIALSKALIKKSRNIK